MARTIHFTKMHGAGNDYIYVYLPDNPMTEDEMRRYAVAWSRPHFGVGSDGLITIDRSGVADFEMRIFNNDGSEARMCGNGVRCVGKFVRDKGLTEQSVVRIDTRAGVKTLTLIEDASGAVCAARVDMGTTEARRLDEGVWVNMGNPHFVTFVPSAETVDVVTLGSAMEHSPRLPERANIEYATQREDGTIRMRVWERGSGVTLACGTGACATAVAAFTLGKADRHAPLEIEMDGGRLSIEWSEADDHVYMTGPAARVFEGVVEIDE